MRNAPEHGTTKRRAATRFDGLVRVVATLLLLVILTVALWVPVELVGSFGTAFVLAGLTLLGAAMASRLYHLRIRVEAIERTLAEPRPTPVTPTQATSPPRKAEEEAPVTLMPEQPPSA